MRFIAFLCLFIPSAIQAQLVMTLSDSTDEIKFGQHAMYTLQEKGVLGIKEIVHLDPSIFSINENALLFFNNNTTNPDVWLRFDMHYTGKRSKELLLELNNPLIDQVAFYWVQNKLVLDSNLCGDDLPFKSRSIQFRNPLFKVRFEPNGLYALYIKCNAGGRKIHVPLTLRSMAYFVEVSAFKDLLMGLFYGILIALTLVYFYLAFIIKEKAFLFLALYLFFLTLSQLAVGGVNYAYLWPNAPYWNNRSIVIFMNLAIVFGFYFARLFVVNQVSIWGIWIFRVLVGLGIISAALSLGPDPFLYFGIRLLYFLIPLDYGLLFIIGVYYLIKRIKVARFFALSFFAATLSIGLMIYHSSSNNMDNIFTNNVVLYVLIVKCIMLSIAMLDRLKIFKEEKELAQKHVIENLEELAQYKESINQQLAQKIREKTQELTSKQNEVKLAIIQGEERERKRIAQELHDGMGSLLATLKLHVESLNLEDKHLNKFEWKTYQGLLEMVDYACVELRDISHNMLPAGIDHFGLDATLKSDISKLNKHKNVYINFYSQGLESIKNKEIELHVYRIVLELLNNVIKHAQASTANLQLMHYEQSLSIIIEDNGVGFNTNINEKSGIGIISVKSRVESLSGKMQIDSIVNSGTTITIVIPLI